jgi:predicted phage gp36 major capsid-like protein
MLNIAANPAITGAELRRIVAAEPTAPHAATLRRIGNLDVQLVRRGNQWTLYLADLVPVPQTTCDQWATAVSAPPVEWQRTPDGSTVWCSWTEG